MPLGRLDLFSVTTRVNAVTGQYNSAAVPSYVTGVSYAPPGAMNQVNLGSVNVQNFCYNNRLQITGITILQQRGFDVGSLPRELY